MQNNWFYINIYIHIYRKLLSNGKLRIRADVKTKEGKDKFAMKATWPVPTYDVNIRPAGWSTPTWANVAANKATASTVTYSMRDIENMWLSPWILIVTILVIFEIKLCLSAVSTVLCLIIGSLSLAWFLNPSTTRGKTSPNRASSAPELFPSKEDIISDTHC